MFGFRVHAAAALARWQDEQREQMKGRLGTQGISHGFETEDMNDGMSESEEDDEEQDGIDDMFEVPVQQRVQPGRR